MNNHNNELSKKYLTTEQIYNMQDDELVGVNRIAINSRITELQIQGCKDIEALQILKRASDEIREREKRCRPVVLWGAKMTVKDVKIAFKDLEYMSRTSFKKII